MAEEEVTVKIVIDESTKTVLDKMVVNQEKIIKLLRENADLTDEAIQSSLKISAKIVHEKEFKIDAVSLSQLHSSEN